MTPTTPPDHKVHEGRNVKRFREMMQMKQEAMAIELGDDWTQKKISLLEAKETIEPALLERVAGILKLPVEALQNFEEENAVNVIANTFNCTDFKDNAAVVNVQPTFDAAGSILKLHEEKMALYERMLQEKDEMMATLKGLLEKK